MADIRLQLMDKANSPRLILDRHRLPYTVVEELLAKDRKDLTKSSPLAL